jgi:hypothetical protein
VEDGQPPKLIIIINESLETNKSLCYFSLLSFCCFLFSPLVVLCFPCCLGCYLCMDEQQKHQREREKPCHIIIIIIISCNCSGVSYISNHRIVMQIGGVLTVPTNHHKKLDTTEAIDLRGGKKKMTEKKLPSVAELLQQHRFLTLLPTNKILCAVTQHEMPPNAACIFAHVNGKKFKRCFEWYSHDFSQYEPYIVPHKKDSKKLFCTLTRLQLNKIPDEIKKHCEGKKFLRLVYLFYSNCTCFHI